MSQPLNTFAFMGCWNKTGCSPGSSQKSVIQILKDYSFELLVLGGDNVYPDKRDGKKHYSEERLKAGFECIQEAYKGPMLVALGNHNIATPALRSYSLSRGLTGEPYSLVIFSNQKAILILDTNNPLPFDWIAEALSYMRLHAIHEYYLVMHEPIVGYKQKKIQVLPEANALLAVLVPQPPLQILTADVHSYQKMRIQFGGTEFLQIISGTGGASLDPLPSQFPEHVNGFSGTIIVQEAIAAYGFQRISGSNNEFIIARLSSLKHSPTKEYGSKTLKRSPARSLTRKHRL